MNKFSLILIVLGLIIIIYNLKPDKKKKINKKYNIKDSPDICILIPARDESRVIKNLLNSIKKQSYKIDFNNVYIIVEEKTDKTISVAHPFGSNIIVRKQLDLKRKGYALDEALKNINKHYDMYFIMDADNILDKDFVKNMIDTYKDGYDIGVGYRNSKNGNENVITACSSCLFSMINTLNSFDNDVIISGTGFFINGRIVKKWQGYPFHSLTEDYELKLYSLLNNLNCKYNKNAIYYDEQPKKMSVTIKQRTRWVKGFFEARGKYLPEIIKSLKKDENNNKKLKEIFIILPYILIIIGIVIQIINDIFMIIKNIISNNLNIMLYVNNIFIILLIIYIIIMTVTLVFIKLDNKINLSKQSKLKILFYNPIFLATFINCAIKAIFSKEIKWDKIEHSCEILLK